MENRSHALAAGLFALVIPGIFLTILWLFAAQAVVVEGHGVRASLRRSGELVRGAWWTVFAPLLMTVLLLRVSGVALLEKDIGERRPAYRDYIATTNAFFPGPARRP